METHYYLDKAGVEILWKNIKNALRNVCTDNTVSLNALTEESLIGKNSIEFHRISKTGLYADLIGVPTIPTKVSELINDNGYITETAFQDVIEIAEGRTKKYVIALTNNEVFNTTAEYFESATNITNILGETIELSNLSIGDIFLVTELTVPDRYVSHISKTTSGTVVAVKFHQLESSKIDLSEGLYQAGKDIEITESNTINMVGKYLPLTGGTLTNDLTVTSPNGSIALNVDPGNSGDNPVLSVTDGAGSTVTIYPTGLDASDGEGSSTDISPAVIIVENNEDTLYINPGVIEKNDYGYRFPDKSGTFALDQDLNNYLPLSGGTIENTGASGDILTIHGTNAPARFKISSDYDDSSLSIDSNGSITKIDPSTNGNNFSIDIPSKTGTVALTSELPTVNNGSLTIQKNGTTVNTFTANSSSNVTANITVPTKTSDITNDSNLLSANTSWVQSTALPSTGIYLILLQYQGTNHNLGIVNYDLVSQVVSTLSAYEDSTLKLYRVVLGVSGGLNLYLVNSDGTDTLITDDVKFFYIKLL